MKKVLLITIISSSMVMAFPSIYGGNGSFYINTAESDAPAILGISVYSTTFSMGDTFYSRIPIGLTWSPLKWAELSFVPGAIMKVPGTFDTSMVFWDDIRIKLKLALPIFPVIKPAAQLETDILTGDTSFFHRSSSGGLAFGGDMIITLDLSEIYPSLPVMDINGGYDGINGDIRFGSSLGWKAQWMSISIPEFHGFYSSDSSKFYIGAGAKLGIVPGGFIGVSPSFEIPDISKWKLSLGLGVISPFIGFAPPKVGTLTGKVVDKINGKPIPGAKVYYAENQPPVETDSMGIFKIEGVKAGLYTPWVEKDGYIPESSAPVEVRDKSTVTLTFKMEPKVKYGMLVVKVKDIDTEKPVSGAQVIIEDRELKPIETDEAGVARFDSVKAGIVRVKIKKDGYIDEVESITIKPYEVVQLSLNITPKVRYATLVIKVRDADTKKPLSDALVSFEDREIEPAKTDETGVARFEKVATGIARLVVEKDGYLKDVEPIVIKPQQLNTVEILMSPSSIKGIFSGKVTDKKTGKPLEAEIIFIDSDIEPIKTDGTTGLFRAEVPVGVYGIKVHSEGYIDETYPILIKKDEPLIKNFELLKKGMEFTFRNIYFEFNKAELKPESYPVLDSVAQFLKEHRNIIVEIQGHTDAIGSERYNLGLSQRRADAVRNYLIMRHGIDPERLIAKGYGENYPVASNATEEGRALNRRVVFKILGSLETK